MSQLTFNPVSGGMGNITNDGAVGVPWSTVHGASAGSVVDTAEVTDRLTTDFTDRFFIHRAFFPFDLTDSTTGAGIPKGSVIQEATFRIYVVQIWNDDNDGDDWVNVVWR